jgi:hypothetical protein
MTASGEAAFFWSALPYARRSLGAGIGEMCCSRLAPIRFVLFHILDLLKRDPDGVASRRLSGASGGAYESSCRRGGRWDLGRGMGLQAVLALSTITANQGSANAAT